jgi:hypothetical protein
MGKKRFLAAAFCAAALAGAGASSAIAGEVKGPPGTGPGTQEQVDANATAAPAHSNSICSFSGLNDMIVGQGRSIFTPSPPDRTSGMAEHLESLAWHVTAGVTEEPVTETRRLARR